MIHVVGDTRVREEQAIEALSQAGFTNREISDVTGATVNRVSNIVYNSANRSSRLPWVRGEDIIIYDMMSRYPQATDQQIAAEINDQYNHPNRRNAGSISARRSDLSNKFKRRGE